MKSVLGLLTCFCILLEEFWLVVCDGDNPAADTVTPAKSTTTTTPTTTTKGPPTPPNDNRTFYTGPETELTEPPYVRITKKRRTTPPRQHFADNCDYLAKYCLLAYETGILCARTLYNTYMTFPTYCLMDYVNCKERYDVWQVAYMGPCFDLQPIKEYANYPYWDDSFLDNIYVME